MASVYKNELDLLFALMALPETGDNEIEVIYIFIIHTNTPTRPPIDQPTHTHMATAEKEDSYLLFAVMALPEGGRRSR